MTGIAGGLNIVLGLAYTGYGVLTLLDLKRGWSRYGYSHFGGAWVAMAFTCGPHHLFHGVHMLAEGRTAGTMDVLTVLIGLPFGVVWLALRVEAMLGRRGDRFIGGTPWWIAAAPTAAGIYLTALVAMAVETHPSGVASLRSAVPNVPLVVIYFAIGYFLLRTQLRNRPSTGGWSLSGVMLTAVFPTCALMHGVFGFYSLTGLYHADIHGFVTDWLAIPAGLYFLWVVRGLYQEARRDWNEPSVPKTQPVSVPA